MNRQGRVSHRWPGGRSGEGREQGANRPLSEKFEIRSVGGLKVRGSAEICTRLKTYSHILKPFNNQLTPHSKSLRGQEFTQIKSSAKTPAELGCSGLARSPHSAPSPERRRTGAYRRSGLLQLGFRTCSKLGDPVGFHHFAPPTWPLSRSSQKNAAPRAPLCSEMGAWRAMPNTRPGSGEGGGSWPGGTR